MTTDTNTTLVKAADYSDIVPDAESYDGYARAVDGSSIPRKLFNRKGQCADGTRITPDVFWDTVYDTVQPELHCIMILAVRTRAWTKYNNAAKRNDYFCTSQDAVTGVLEQTLQRRKCEGCPDAKWRKNEEGKQVTNCSEIRTVLCVDDTNYEPFMLRFQKTSAKPLTQYLARYHDGRLVPKGQLKRYNLPLYAHHCSITLKMSDNGNFALPVLTFGRKSTPQEAELARDTIQAMTPVLEAAAADRTVDDQHDAEQADQQPTDPAEF